MSPLRLNGSTSGYSQLDAPAIAGDQTFTLPGTGGTIDRLNRAGNILQVIYGSTSTSISTSTSAWVDTTLSATITPTLSSSKILILVSQNGLQKYTSNTSVGLQLLRGSTSLIVFDDGAGYTATTTANLVNSSVKYLDSPGTTSATTYKTQIRSSGNSASVAAQASGFIVNPSSTIILLEVAA